MSAPTAAAEASTQPPIPGAADPAEKHRLPALGGLAVSLGDEVVAVTVGPGEADEEVRAEVGALRRDWELWRPGCHLVEIPSARREPARPLVRYLQELRAAARPVAPPALGRRMDAGAPRMEAVKIARRARGTRV